MKRPIDLKEEAQYRPVTGGWQKDELYIFTEEQLDAFVERLCEEQIKACADYSRCDTVEDEDGIVYIPVDKILNTEIPQYK